MTGKSAKSHSQQTREMLQIHYAKKASEEAKVAELEKLLREQENMEVGDIMRDYNLTPEEVAEMLKSLKGHVPEEQPHEDIQAVNSEESHDLEYGEYEAENDETDDYDSKDGEDEEDFSL